jgi:hypothetical protein
MGRGVIRRFAVRVLPSALLVFAAASAASASTLAASGVAAAATPRTLTGRSQNVLDGHSYSLVTNKGGLIGFGAAISSSGQTSPTAAFVGGAPTPDGRGAWLAAANGAVETLGDATYFGSMAGHKLAKPIVGIAATPTGGGYWLVASDGGIFAFGNAAFHGSTGAMHLQAPVVGMGAMPTGGGYWLVASDGGIFTFGDAGFYGSTGGKHLQAPVVGMSVAPAGNGYWLVASDGGIFTFGAATFHGSAGAQHLTKPIVGMAATPTGGGYWLTASDGGVFAYGDAPFFGSAARFGRTVVGIDVELGGYQNPLRAVSNLTPERIDQGVDYSGSGPIYAVGDGVVLNTTNTGWPGGAFITYQLSDGPAAGDIVYVAENVAPRVTIGQQVNSDTVLGTLVDAYPNLETGWADPPGNGLSLARADGQWTTAAELNSLPTAYGANFSQLLTMLGAPAGLMMGPIVGSIAPGWPTWLPHT